MNEAFPAAGDFRAFAHGRRARLLLSTSLATGVIAGMLTFAPTPARAQSTWDAGAPSTNWGTATNWAPDGLPGVGATVSINNGALAFQPVINGGDAFTVNQTNVSAGSLGITGTLTSPLAISGTGTVTVNAGGGIVGAISVATGAQLQLNAAALGAAAPITLNGGTLNSIAGGSSVAGTITLGAASSIVAGAGLMNLNGAVDNGGNLLTTQAGPTAFLTFVGGLSGAGGLTVAAGDGRVQLQAATTYAGPTTVDVGGGLNLTVANAIGGGGPIVVNGLLSMFDGTQSFSSLSGSGLVDFAANGTLTVGSAGTSTTFSGQIREFASVGNIVKTGAGTLTLTGDNRTGANAYTGTTTIDAGAISIGAANNIGGGAIGLNGGSLQATGTFTLANAVNATAAGSSIDVTGANNLTLGGSLGGANSFTKTGAGTLTFGAGLNTAGHTGGMTLQQGTLSLQTGLAAGFGAIVTTGSVIDYGNGVNNLAAVQIAGNTTQFQTLAGVTATQTGVVSEDAAGRPLEKIGTGTLVLAGANTYTGPTTITAGTLDVTGSVASTVVTVNTGGQLIVNGASIADAAAVTLNGTGNLTLAANETIGSLASASAASTVTIGGNALTTGGNNASTTFAGAMTGNGSFSHAGAGTLTLTGDGSAFTGVLGATGAGSQVAITGAGTTAAQGVGAVAGATFSTDGGALLANNAVLATDGAIVFTGSETVGTLTNAATNGFGTGTIALDGAGTILTVTGAANLLNPGTINGFGGVISGAGELTKAGAGTLTLTGANTYVGPTTVNGGTLNVIGSVASSVVTVNTGASLVVNGASIADTAAVTLNGTGNLTLAASEAIGSLASASATSTATLNANTLTTGGNNASTTFAGVISGVGGGLTKAGTGTFTLTGANTYTGLTTVAAGVLNIQNDAALGSIVGGTIVQAGAALQLQGGIAVGVEALTLNGAGIGGAGALQNVSGFNFFAGAVALGSAATISSASGSLSVNGAVANGGNLLTSDGAGGTVFGSSISGAGGLTKNGAGTVDLFGVNTYTGATTVNAGTLTLNNGQAIADTGTLVVNGGNVLLTDSETIGSLSGVAGTTVGFSGPVLVALNTGGDNTSTTYAGALVNAGGAGLLTKVGTGTFTLTGANTYTGTTTVNAGTLSIGAGGTAGSIAGGPIVIGAAGTLALNRSDAVALANVITGTGTLNQIGAGATTLSGNSAAFAGTTNVNAGSLIVTGQLGGTVNVNAGGTLGGNGTVSTAGLNTNINAGGTLSAGLSPGTLTVAGNLNLAAGSTSVFELNTTQQVGGIGATGNDLVNVGGNLAIANGAILTVAPQVSGYYRLFNVGGTITPGGGANLGFTTINAGAGVTTASVYASSAAPNQVNLFLANGGQLVQAWDGADFTGAAPGGQGGAGTWNAGNTNWTQNPGGVINDFWRSQVGFFGGAAGAVTVAGAQSFQGLQFATTGYTLAGGSLNATGNAVAGGNAAASFLNVDAGVTTTVASAITSAAGIGIDKLGGGTLVLTGVNTYSGLTDIQAGVVNIQNAAALGVGTGVAADGTRVRAGAALELQGDIAVANELLFLNGTGIANAGALRSISGNNVWGGDIELETNGRLNADAGLLTIGGRIRLPAIVAPGVTGRDLAVGGAGNTTINGVIAIGSGALTKDGAGLLTLNNVNTFTGLTTVAAGTLINNGVLPGAVTNNAAFTNNGSAGSLANNGVATNNGLIGAGVLNTLTFANTATGVVNGGLVNTAGTTTNAGVINSGATNAAGATIITTNQINGGLTNSGAVQAQGQVNGAILNQAAGTFTTTGALTGNDAFANTGTARLNVTGGNFTGLTALTNSSTAPVATPGVAVGAGFTLGTVTIANAANASFVSAGAVNATTSFTNAGAANMAGALNTPLVANTGVFNVTGALGGATGAFNNTGGGVLSVTGGDFTGIGALTNSSTAAPGVNIAATRAIGAATILNNAGSAFSSAGTVNAATSFTNAGAANMAGVLNSPLAINSGAFTVTADLSGATAAFNNSGAGTLAVTGGNFTGIGALTNSSSAIPGVTVAAGRTLGAATIQNNAGSRVTSAGSVAATTGFTNAGVANLVGTLTTPLAANSGTFATTGALGGATAAFTNTGAVNISAGNFTGVTTFNNAGALIATGGGARTLGAATFNNQATGIVNQQNGATTDVLTVTGNYVGAAGSRILQDVNLANTAGGAANGDRLVINGSASGQSTLAFNILGGNRTIFATPIPVLQATGGSAGLNVNEGRFESRGFFDYFLRRSPGGAGFEVVSQFNSAPAAGVAGGVSGVISSLQAGFHQPASAIVSRPDNCTPNQLMGGPFIRLSAGDTTIQNKSAGDIAGGGSPFSSSTKSSSNFKGFQTGADFGVCNIQNTDWNFHFGVMAGLVDVSSSGNSRSPTPVAGADTLTRTRASSNVPFVGLYSFVTNGPFTAEVNVRRDFYDMKISTSDATTTYIGPNQKLKGDGLSFNASLSYRFTFAERFYIEPQVGLSKSRTSFDLLPFATGTGQDFMRFNDTDSLLGRVGFNAGAAFFLTDKFVAAPFVSASVWREFGKPVKAQAVISSSNQTFLVETDRIGTFGQVGAGVQFKVIDTPLVGFIRGDVRFGEKVDGKAINAGLRLQF